MEKRIFLFWGLFFLSLFSLAAQTGGEFFFSYDGEEKPVFIQRIKWKGSPYASKYRFILKDRSNNIVFDQEVKESFVDLSLTFGEYTFRIATFNVLGKIETIGKWEKLSIKKAVIPKMGLLSPHEVFLDEWKSDEFVLAGNDFEPGAKVYQILLASKVEVPIVSLTKNRIVFNISKEKVLQGSTVIRVQNSNGIYADIPLSVRNKKPVDFLLSLNYPFFYLHGGLLSSIGKSLAEGGVVFDAPEIFRFPVGIGFDMILYPYKSSQGDFGIGFNSTYRYVGIYSEAKSKNSDYITLHSHLLDLEFLLYYRYSINLNYGFYSRLGAGVSFQFYRFDFQGIQVDPAVVSLNTLYPTFLAGVGFQFVPYKGLLILLGFDYSVAIQKDEFLGVASPYVGIGYQF